MQTIVIDIDVIRSIILFLTISMQKIVIDIDVIRSISYKKYANDSYMT